MDGAPLFLFNSMGRTLEQFVPVRPGQVGIYSCGPTVYNYAHLGNLRAYVFTDTLRRTLMWKGYQVRQVMNITDVGHLTSDADDGEDKMELAAGRQKRTVWDIAQHYTDAFTDDLARLNILPAHEQPRATDHIDAMVAFNRQLVADGHAYELADGLYFDTSTVPDYGKLGLLDTEGLQAGARVAVTEGKRHTTDFCLWRCSPADSKRLMEWDSPWGTGVPGWHLECSVMSLQYLGDEFDIHTGGIDHRQVHHANEIAQNMGHLGHGKSGIRYWMHNEFLVVGADKMSKSSGDFLRLQTVIDRGIHPLVYRFFCLQASYRNPLEFNWDALAAAHQGLRRLYLRCLPVRGMGHDAVYAADGDGPIETLDTETLMKGLTEAAQPWLTALDAAISDDLNTPRALANLNGLLADDTLGADDMARLVALHEQILGLKLLTQNPDDLMLRAHDAPLSDAEVDALLAERITAREARDFARADEIRDSLTEAGVQLKDGAAGTTWEWAISRPPRST